MPKGIPRNQTAQRKILHRYKIARGHLDKVISMIEGGDYCIDIVHQSLAVQSALRKSDEVILENHLKTCVGASDDAIREIIQVIKKK